MMKFDGSKVSGKGGGFKLEEDGDEEGRSCHL